MKQDISTQTDQEIGEIIKKLKDNGWEQEDISYISKLVNNKKIEMVLYPELLSYYSDYDRRYVTVPWICVKYEYYLDDMKKGDISKNSLTITEGATNEMIKAFEDIGIKPFYDEDAPQRHFNINRHLDEITLKMYVNPSYPNGIWQNHTL